MIAEAPARPDNGLLTSKDAISCLIGAQGDAKLAAVRARKATGDETITEPLLLAAIAADPNAPGLLYRQMQVLLALQAFSAFRVTQMAFLEKVPNMSPDTVARTYTTMLRSMSEITRSAGTAPVSLDPIRGVLDALPPEIADAVERLMLAQPSLEDQTSQLELLSQPPTADPPCEAPEDEAA